MIEVDDVPTAVWLAAAVLAYDRALTLRREGRHAPYDEEVFAFPQVVIQRVSQELCAKVVHNARISQWCNADHSQSSYNYLREVGRMRRLTFRGECRGIRERPTFGPVEDGVLFRDRGDGHPLELGELLRWVNEQYPLLIRRGSR